MKKSKRKQMKKWARWGREVAEAQRHARAELSARASKRGTTLASVVADDAGIEKAIRKIHGWAGDRVADQDKQEIATIGALQRLQHKMAEALDLVANLVGSALDPLPETSGASSSKTSRPAGLTARDVEFLNKNPDARRGFLEAQAQLKDGTWALTAEQRELGKRLGLNREALAAISAALSARSPPRAGPSNGSGPRTLTPELLAIAAKMQITDPERVRALAEAMAKGPPSKSAVMQFARPAAA